MARKIDTTVVVDTQNAGTHRDSLVGSIGRVIAVWTASSYQTHLVNIPDLPPGDQVIPALYRLASAGPRRPSQLAAELHISAAAVSRLIDRLSTAGLTQRSPDPTDSRASLVVLTDAGRQTAGRVFAAGDTLMNDLLAHWSSTDREQLDRLMTRFAAEVETDAANRRTTSTIN